MRQVDRLTHGRPDLLRAVECAVIPRAWDEAFLLGLLDGDAATDAATWHERLTALPVVESCHSQPGFYRVQNDIRLALRGRLHVEGRLVALAEKALEACEKVARQHSSLQVLERLCHLLLARPHEGVVLVEEQWREWFDQGRWTELDEMAAALDEVIPHLGPAALAWALLRRATILLEQHPVAELVKQAQESVALFKEAGDAGHGLAQALRLMGDLETRAGNLSAALVMYQESGLIYERLVAGDEDNTKWLRCLALARLRLGDTKRERNLVGDLEMYRDGKALCDKLIMADPASPVWQGLLASCLSRLGHHARAYRLTEEARRCYEESRAIRVRLAAADPGNVTRMRELAVSCGQLGDLACDQGNWQEAQRIYEHNKLVFERLAEGGYAPLWLAR